eukprot:12603861-Ditylum_brightwellii.AAC.1
MNLDNSIVMCKENAEMAFAQIEAGENIVQSKADQQVFSILLEAIGHGEEASVSSLPHSSKQHRHGSAKQQAS